MGRGRVVVLWLVASVVVVGAATPILLVRAQDRRAALVAQGERFFTEQGCYGCHTLGKFGTPIAADLTRIGARYGEADLVRWLTDPASQKPTAHMPKLQLAPDEAVALAAFLASQR